MATAMTRKPSALSSLVPRRIASRAESSSQASPSAVLTRVHADRISSRAPLQISSWLPSPSRSLTTTDMRRREKSKGISSIFR